MTIHIHYTDGESETIKGNFKPNLAWLQGKVGGFIEIINLLDNVQMVVNEEAIFKRLEPNPTATQIYRADLDCRYKLPQSELNRIFICGVAVVLEGRSRVT